MLYLNCPVCNEKLKDSSQKFCHNCGTSLEDIKEPPKSEITPQQYQQETIPKINIEKNNQIDKHSRKAFIFGIISLASFIVGFILGLMLIVLDITFVGIGLGFNNIGLLEIILIIIILNLHILGMVLGIVGKGQSNETESNHALKIIGNIFSIIGIVLNSIGLTTSIIGLLILTI